MKIGILTFHSQLNYGGVLQCCALQTTLQTMGHEVVVIDRWLHADNRYLECGFNKWRIGFWTKFLLRAVMGSGDWAKLQRVRKTKGFLKAYLNLTPYHFVEWKDAPKDIGLDMLVVGSDQVWHCGDFGDPRVYLLQNAPLVPAIAYAASFGFAKIPKFVSAKAAECVEALPIYKEGLARFSAISCREEEGVNLCRELGYSAVHVLDPTLLLDEVDWNNIVKVQSSKRKRIVCYFMSEDILSSFAALGEFVKSGGHEVTVLLNSGLPIPMPTTPKKFVNWMRLLSCKHKRHFEILESAGPAEFVNAIANADFVISDSFHALMFSIIFGKNVRILKPKTEMRKRMISRIREIASHMRGELFADGVADALSSYARNEVVEMDKEWLSLRRTQSLKFLKENLNVH